MEILYRSPQIQDLERLAEIYNHAVHETVATFDTEAKAPDYFESFVPGDNLYRMLVATVDGQIVAYAGTYPFSQRKAYAQLAEMMIYVHPSWQRQRIGRALLGEIHKNNFLGGLHTVLVLINMENKYMHRLFEEMGYVYKGEMTDVAFKFGRRHSLVIYQRNVGE